ncbi:MAG TPA: ferritin-like domain-containing protein [Chitinophagaceae bacterium]|nr:ferritin-like domain-containing protein [Chitinophagaceae bacterium]
MKSTVLTPMEKNYVGEADHNRLRMFFIESLKDIYYAEQHLVDELENLRDEATTLDLKNAFIEHRTVTQGHVTRLEHVFRSIGEEPDTKKCQAIKGIINEADSIISDTENDTLTRDAALILAAQKAEHYEIATYGTLVQFAKVLGEHNAAELLEETLREEKEADVTLTRIAESFINENAGAEMEH